MVRCTYCYKDMKSKETIECRDSRYITLKDREYERNTTYFNINERCHDCNILNKKGNLHHFGCDIERCPRCKGQLISCGCLE